MFYDSFLVPTDSTDTDPRILRNNFCRRINLLCQMDAVQQVKFALLCDQFGDGSVCDRVYDLARENSYPLSIIVDQLYHLVEDSK